jgi:glycosyltransferase involved in cell wall biosynthesis
VSQPNDRPRLVFVVTEDWFFAERFLAMGQVAKRNGFDVFVVARERDHRRQIEAEGITLVALEAERRSVNPFALVTATWQLRSILKRLRPDVVHCIAMKGIVMGGIACALAGVEKRVYAPTGWGVFADGNWRGAHHARQVLVHGIRRLETSKTKYLFENSTDPRTFGLDPTNDDKVRLVGGAGIDPSHFVPSPMPPLPPLRVAIVSRMVRSKGIDTAVEAVTMARAQGVDVELSLYGSPDDASVQSFSEAQLRAWSLRDGISWHGPTSDVASVWRQNHVCCVPSRGGEGLPRTLLEAAAAGRALLTTDVAGCGEFVRKGVDGLVVPPQNAVELCEALKSLAQSRERLEGMGTAARARVLDGYTLTNVEACVERIHADVYRS